MSTALDQVPVESRGPAKAFAFEAGDPSFSFITKDQRQYEWLMRADDYSAAMAFVRGEFEVEGDLVAAIHYRSAEKRRRGGRLAPPPRAMWRLLLERLRPLWQKRSQAARDIQYHYDRSNEFYRLFLDPRMVYSTAYFRNAEMSLADAQAAKIEHICKKLNLRPGDRFLDIGCGWGALILHAAARYGALATGCTLSHQQRDWVWHAVNRKNLGARIKLQEVDVRNLEGHFDKISSIGMFEHVNAHWLPVYFRKVHEMLNSNGLFLNSGVVEPAVTRPGSQTVFLRERVFPGSHLASLPTVLREAEAAGFEVLDVENLRPHYALTCRRWVERLRRNVHECLTVVSAETYRTWLLYLAGSAVTFEQGGTDIHEILLAKRGSAARPLTREYMYA